MIRKVFVTVAIVLVGGFLLVGRNFSSYVRTGWADPQRVQLPALRGRVGQRDQLGAIGVGSRERLKRGLDLSDIQISHLSTP